LDTIGPVFEVNIDLHVAENGILDDAADLADMLLRRLSELRRKMVKRAFAEEIDDASAGILDPGQGVSSVDESEHFDFLEITLALGPFSDLLEGFEIAVGNTRRGDLDPVDLDLIEKDLGYA
jgi:hypothetical protein